MTSQHDSEPIATQILPNISRSKGNQTMKFGQLIECNMRNILLKNYTQNAVEKLFLDPFLRNENSSYLCVNSLEALYSLFFWYTNLKAIEI